MAEEPDELPAVHEAWLPREHALHRPRHGGRQLLALVCALVFFATPTVLWGFGARPAEIENHKLAGFPSMGNGWGFFTGMPEWATDQLVFRAAAIRAADGISRGVFGESAPLDQGGQVPGGPLPGSPPPPGEQPTQPGPGQPGHRTVVEGSDGWLYYGLDAESKCHPVRPLTETVARLNELRRAVEDSGREFVFVVPPDKTTMVPGHLPSSYPNKECSQRVARDFWRLVTGRGRALDLRPQLAALEQRLGRPAYSPKDTHWTDEGAITMTRSIAESVRPGVADTWQTQPVGTYSTRADLPVMLGRHEEKTNVQYDLAPDGRTDRTGKVVTDIDSPLRRTTTPARGMITRPTLVFGDSFVNASSRYLPAGFSNLTMMAYPPLGNHVPEAVNAFVQNEVIVIEAVERAVASGNLSFLGEEFIRQVRAAMAAQPVR